MTNTCLLLAAEGGQAKGENLSLCTYTEKCNKIPGVIDTNPHIDKEVFYW